MRSTYRAVKASCPRCQVVQGGAANPDLVDQFWPTFFQRGGGAYIDVANVHYIAESEPVSKQNAMTLNTTWIAGLLRTHGLRRPLWITEVQFLRGTEDIESPVKAAMDASASRFFFTGIDVTYEQYVNVIEKHR